MADEFRVMTSGAFTAAHLELLPQLEKLTKKKVVTATTSVGTGEQSIPNRLKRGDVVDIVIVADTLIQQLIKDGLVLTGHTTLARSSIGLAVREGAPKPEVGTAEALRKTLLQAKGIGYSASVSGTYVTTELYQRLGIANECVPKSRLIGGGERVGAVIARGELDIGFQQMSELLPVKGIAHITPLPPDLQKVSLFSAGVAASSTDPELARKVIAFLASEPARAAITRSGLEPV